MNNIDATTSGEILETIEAEQPTLAVSIRDLMFTFEDFLEVSEVQLRALTGARGQEDSYACTEERIRELKRPLLFDNVVSRYRDVERRGRQPGTRSQ